MIACKRCIVKLYDCVQKVYSKIAIMLEFMD
jgi:hypothetical protein